MSQIIKNVQLNPELANIELGEIKLEYTNHAKNQLIKRNINYMQFINIVKGSVVETEQDSKTKKTNKLVVRVPYDNYTDKVYVLVEGKYNQQLRVLTVWLNQRNDKHTTLNVTRLAS